MRARRLEVARVAELARVAEDVAKEAEQSLRRTKVELEECEARLNEAMLAEMAAGMTLREQQARLEEAAVQTLQAKSEPGSPELAEQGWAKEEEQQARLEEL